MWNCVEKHQEQTAIVCVHGNEFTIAPKLHMQGFQISTYNHKKKKKIKEIVRCFGVVKETFVPITCTPPISPIARFSKIRCKLFITLQCSTLLQTTNNTTTDELRHYKIHTDIYDLSLTSTILNSTTDEPHPSRTDPRPRISWIRVTNMNSRDFPTLSRCHGLSPYAYHGQSMPWT